MVETVRVGALDYTIAFQKPSSKTMIVEDMDCAGTVHYASQKINLINNMAGQYTYKVLLHEMTHAMLEQVTHDEEIYSNEGVVDQLSMYMFQIIRDNPQLIKEIWETCGVKYEDSGSKS